MHTITAPAILSRTFRALDSWWLDVKLGARVLCKYPGLTLAGGVGIAVAVAIATGGFSIIYGAFLVSAIPLEEGDRIVSLEMWDTAANRPQRHLQYDYPMWSDRLQSVRELSAFRTTTPNLISPGVQPGSVRVAEMSASGFRIARVRPQLGRYLAEEDEHAGAPSVAVIGEGVWRDRFASDPAIVGRNIQLGTTQYSIVGVMPERFAFPVNHQVWVPLRAGTAPTQPLAGPELMLFGRLAPGATLPSAQAELTIINQRTAKALPAQYAQLRPRILPYPFPFVGLHDTTDITGLHLMQGLATSLLLLVCLNVAILVYARTAMRQGEIAVRTALGASRGRIVIQLFIEALLLALGAALAGTGIAALTLHLIGDALREFTGELPFWISFRLSPEAVLWAGALSVLAAAIVGILPALKATRREVNVSLSVIGAGGSGMRLGTTWTTLIVVQAGIAVALLPAAVFSVWQSARSGFADPGFAAAEYLSVQVGMEPGPGTEAAASNPQELTARHSSRQIELLRQLRADPQVTNATVSLVNPGEEPTAKIEIHEGVPPLPATGEIRFNYVDVHFFRVFEIPILAGRGFEASDLPPSGANPALPPDGGPVVVNHSLALRLFGGNALGRRIRYANPVGSAAVQNRERERWFEIVGIISDFPAGTGAGMTDSKLRLYHPIAAGQLQPATIAVHVRGGAPANFATRMREIAAVTDPSLQLRKMVSLDDALRKDQWIRLLEGAVFAAVTLSVLLLSAAGIYALLSLTVSQRRKEIGIRMALGADPWRIVASIFSRAFRQLAIGAVLGMGAAAMLERALWGDLMQEHVAVVLPIVALIVIGVGFLGAFGPARRSLRVHPTESLRQ